MKTYTLGEILRLGLLKNHKGESYKHKATISKIARELGAKEQKTPFGLAKCLTEDQIDAYNNKWKEFT